MKNGIVGLLVLLGSAPLGHACTDFSGYWRGNCVAGQDGEAVYMAWQQNGCGGGIKEGTLPYAVDGSENVQEWNRGDGLRSHRVMTYRWNEDQSALNGTLAMTMTHLASGKQVMSINADTSVRLEDKKLNIVFKGTMTMPNGTMPFLETCSFAKVGNLNSRALSRPVQGSAQGPAQGPAQGMIVSP